MPTLIPGEQRQTILLDGEPLRDVDKFKYVGSMFIANDQDTQGLRSRINLARSEVIKDLLLPTPSRGWRGRTGVQLKTWTTTIKTDLEPLSRPRVFGYTCLRMDG